MHSQHVTSDKKINELYVKFKEKYRVPKSYIDTVLKLDKEFKIYNTEEEQNKYIKYWTERSVL